jgi:hypothetical protein
VKSTCGNTPNLLVQVGNDLLVEDALRELLPANYLKVVTVDNGHFPYIAAPDFYTQHLMDFLKNRWKNRPDLFGQFLIIRFSIAFLIRGQDKAHLHQIWTISFLMISLTTKLARYRGQRFVPFWVEIFLPAGVKLRPDTVQHIARGFQKSWLAALSLFTHGHSIGFIFKMCNR